MIALLALFTLVQPVTLQAQTYSYEQLKDRFVPLVKTLKRKIRVYHYAKRGDGAGAGLYETISVHDIDNSAGLHGPVPLQSEIYNDYFKSMTRHFELQDGPDWSLGKGGLYAASDPLQSASYAYAPPILLEIEVQEGSRYLDLTPYLVNGLQSKLETKEARDLIKELNIDFVVFRWFPIERWKISLCPRNVDQLFSKTIFFPNSEAINHVSITAVTPNSRLENLAHLAKIYHYYVEHHPNQESALRKYGYTQFIGPVLDRFSYLPNHTWPSDPELETMIRRQTLGCNREQHPEEL